ncbi:hypothetical protein QQS21_007475 [Conoideocrella luteorostrata]|uniref:DNA ligase D 3'-phosphoesterase domain-containing protein n=1 Tax=Conoideocrella luteorostrata TaxID=1105319 RepID=A0AAJ0CKL9_9HYPO|nr:hypothetical protein QQS21_007475 [Conoideocrella luteorostrata]
MASSKRPAHDLIPNPFIKKRNLTWTLHSPFSGPPSSPPVQTPNNSDNVNSDTSPGITPSNPPAKPSTSDIESGSAQINDHLIHFTTHLARRILPSLSPLLPIANYSSLYTSSLSHQASHFVIHQHDHPIAGTHYDLRLQINPTSSVSWAIMYGLPGDPNSSRLNRNATETRIHSLWNHLIETASRETGSLLIWDTGTYTVIPRRSKSAPKLDPSSQATSSSQDESTQQSLLETAFHCRKIRLRLHGAKLPKNYVLNLRLTKTEDAEGRAKNLRMPKRRRRVRNEDPETGTSDSETDEQANPDREKKTYFVSEESEVEGHAKDVSATDKELRELEDADVRRTNAYPGATNSIGSIHQRKWYVSLDREACGFVQQKHGNKIVWDLPDASTTKPRNGTGNDEGGGEQMQRLSFPFYVRGVAYEQSVVTGRRGQDIMHDEGVKGFVQRKGWKPVLN